MNKLILALALCTAVSAPAFAGDAKILDNPDLTMTVGYKLWLNNWSSWDVGRGGANFVSFSQGGVANMLPMAIKYKNFFTTLNLMFTGDYTFPTYTDVTNGGVTQTIQQVASRNEVDWNAGYYVVPNQLAFTVGLKDVSQHWRSGVNGGPLSATTDWDWFGPTLGITAAAPIGNGFSIYGNGVGGFLAVSQNPSPTVARSDSASYEATELGIAWKPAHAPINVSFGYKYQRINTKLDIAGTAGNSSFADLRGLDVTSGYTLGVNVIF